MKPDEGAESRSSSARRVVGATFSYGLAAYLPRVVSLLLLPFYFAILTPSQFGLLEICVVFAVLLETISRLALPGALARLYIDAERDHSERDLVTTLFLGAAFFSLVFALAAAPLVSVGFAWLVPEGETSVPAWLVVAPAFLRFGQEMQLRLLQAREQATVALRLLVLHSAVGASTRLVVLFSSEPEVWELVAADTITAGFALAVALWMHRADLWGHFRRSMLVAALRYGAPLVPYRFGSWLQRYSGQWVLAGLGDLELVAALAAANRLVMPLRLGTQAFAQAIPPIYFRWRAELDTPAALQRVRAVAAGSLLLVEIGALATTVFGAWLVRAALPPSYAPVAWVLAAVAATEVTRMAYTNLCLELFYAKRTTVFSTLLVVTGPITVLGTAAFAAPFGAPGAALGPLLGGIVSMVLVSQRAQRDFPSALGRRLWWGVLASGVGLLLAHCLAGWPIGAAVLAGSALLVVWTLLLMRGMQLPPMKLAEAIRTLRRP